MGEFADEAREAGYNEYAYLSKEEREQYKIEYEHQRFISGLERTREYDNSVWRDRNGVVKSFLEMDGFHLWNIKQFILRSHNKGLYNKLAYIDLALAWLNYKVEDYRKDCERLAKGE